MDARDIKANAPEVKDHRYLEKIYELQKELIDHYVKIEGLPPYPINVNPKKSQVLIKDFVGRVIEELGEGYESMILIDKISIETKYWQGEYTKNQAIMCIDHLQNVSEEFADAMHFMTELLIYVNIQPEDIHKYILKAYDKEYHQFFKEEETDILNEAMMFGLYQLVGDNELDGAIHPVNLLTSLVESVSAPLTWDEIGSPVLYQAGSVYSHSLYLETKKCLWDVTYHLNIARNFLKNKPWKQSQMMTDEIHFQEEIVKAFIAMMGAFRYLNLDSETLYQIYFKKHEANAFRIRSNY